MPDMLIARRLFASLLVIFALIAPISVASGLDPLLQVDILHEDGSLDRSLALTQADLDAMERTQIITSTPWTAGVHRFEGVALDQFLASLQVTTGTMYMYAVNDYMVEVPISDAVPDGPIIAFATDGKPMPLRDKGPLWLVYPFDAKPEYRSELIFTRAIWQLNRIEIRP